MGLQRPFFVTIGVIAVTIILINSNISISINRHERRDGPATARRLKEILPVQTGTLGTDPEGTPVDPRKETHKNWQQQKENSFSKEREASCNNPDADKANLEGVAVVRAYLNLDWRAHGTFIDALPHFETGIQHAPNCVPLLLNYGITLWANSQNDKAKEQFDTAGNDEQHPLKAKVSLWKGVVQETARGWSGNANALYQQAIKDNADIGMEYFGLFPSDAAGLNLNLVTDARLSGVGRDIELDSMKKLLLAKEFIRYFSGHSAIQRHEAQKWPYTWSMFIIGAEPPFVRDVVQLNYRKLINSGALQFKDPQAVRYIAYNDAVGRFLQAQYKDLVERIVDEPVKPTYTYFGGYIGHSILHPHTDRPQCEFTFTLNVDINPAEAYCPIGHNAFARPGVTADFGGNPHETKPPSDDQRYVWPKPGDALLFRGRHLIHWRNEIPAETNCSQVFLHYVKKDFKGKLG